MLFYFNYSSLFLNSLSSLKYFTFTLFPRQNMGYGLHGLVLPYLALLSFSAGSSVRQCKALEITGRRIIPALNLQNATGLIPGTKVRKACRVETG